MSRKKEKRSEMQQARAVGANNNVFAMSHPDSDPDATIDVGESSGAGTQHLAQPNDQTAAVIAAVRGEFRSNKFELVEEVRKEVLPSIEAAVKRALGQSSSTDRKRQKRTHVEFRNKGNQKRFEANEHIIEKVEDALDAVGT